MKALHVTIDEINDQRAKGWPDFHPEDYCHRCGGLNIPSWWVDSDRFNTAMGPSSLHQWNGIVCPGCFVEMHEAATGLTCTWMLVPDPTTTFRPIEPQVRAVMAVPAVADESATVSPAATADPDRYAMRMLASAESPALAAHNERQESEAHRIHAEVQAVCAAAAGDGRSYSSALEHAFGWSKSLVQTRIARARKAGYDIPSASSRSAARVEPPAVVVEPVEVPPRVKSPRGKLAQTAEIYKATFAAGGMPVTAVADHFDIDRRDAIRLITDARGLGLLPPRDQPPVQAVLPDRCTPRFGAARVSAS